MLAKNLNIIKLYIELDAKVVVTILTSHNVLSYSSYPCSTLIFNCKSLSSFLREPTSVRFTVKGINVWSFWQEMDLLVVIALFCIHTHFPLFCTSYFQMLRIFHARDFVILSSVELNFCLPKKKH